MELMSERQDLFLIDVRCQRVYCRSCRQPCKKLVLPEFIQYWCANLDCDNSGEVRLSRNGKWNTFSVVELWFGNRFSRFSSRLAESKQD